MTARGWWWQRYHPALRVFVVTVYFGAAIALFVFSIATGLTDSMDPVSSAEQSAPLTGTQLYQNNCSSCHGASLEGADGPRLGPGSEAADETDNRILSQITNGKGDMPGFSATLSENEIELLFEYLRDQQLSR